MKHLLLDQPLPAARLKLYQETAAEFPQFRWAPAVPTIVNGRRIFTNIAWDHPFAGEVIEVESANHGAPYDDTHYNGLPWADGKRFDQLRADPVAYHGYFRTGTGSFFSGQGPGKRRL